MEKYVQVHLTQREAAVTASILSNASKPVGGESQALQERTRDCLSVVNKIENSQKWWWTKEAESADKYRFTQEVVIEASLEDENRSLDDENASLRAELALWNRIKIDVLDTLF